MPGSIDEQIEEAAQLWSQFFKKSLTSHEEKTEINALKSVFGTHYENYLHGTRLEAASVADIFEATLKNILKELIQSSQRYRPRGYIDYKSCELRSYDVRPGAINLYYDYHPYGVLREALHRASLITGIDLESSALYAFPYKMSEWLEINEEYQIQPQPNHDPKINVAQNYERCEHLRNARRIAREEAIKQYEIDKAERSRALALPTPTLQENLLQSAKAGAMHGLLRGSTRLLGEILEKKNNFSRSKADTVSQAAYYGGIFVISLAQQSEKIEDFTSCVNAIYCSVIETGQVAMLNGGLALLTRLIDKTSSIISTESVRAGNSLKKCSSLLQYGIFCKGAVDRGIAAAAASISAGVATQFVVEKIGKRFI